MSCAAKAAWIISEEEPGLAAAFLFDIFTPRGVARTAPTCGAKLARLQIEMLQRMLFGESSTLYIRCRQNGANLQRVMIGSKSSDGVWVLWAAHPGAVWAL